MARVWLVRHGESTANAGARGETPAGTPLTQKGEDQARAVASKLLGGAAGKADRVLVSPFIRTRQTATPYADLSGLRMEEWPIQEWIFLNPDKYVGTTQEERRPAVDRFFEQANPTYCDGGGAESFMTFVGRVDFFLAAARALGGKTVAFTHGRFVQGVLWRIDNPDVPPWTEEAFRSYWRFWTEGHVENCHVAEISGCEPRWRRV